MPVFLYSVGHPIDHRATVHGSEGGLQAGSRSQGQERNAALSYRIEDLESPPQDPLDSLLLLPKHLLPPAIGPSSSSSDSAKKGHPSPLNQCWSWLNDWLEKPAAATLSERCATALAASWSDHLDVQKQMKELGDSDMALVFKAEVAVHLKGFQLVAFLHNVGGLDALMQRCWPEVFQRLLTSVYKEIARFDQTPRVRQALSRCIRRFREATESRTTFHPAVHRLGLTGSYDQGLLDDEDVWLLEFYKAQDCQEAKLGFCPLLVYPLPYALRIDVGLVEHLADITLKAPDVVCKRMANWRHSVRGSDQEAEKKGLALSDVSREFRRSTYPPDSPWSSQENASPYRRRLLLLRSMVMSHLNGGVPQVIVAAILALTHPFYGAGGLRRDQAVLLRPLQADVYRYLARALSWMHAQIDLPLACVAMMRKAHSEQLSRLCLGDRARLVLTQMEILVRYGLMTKARDLFWFWFGCWPSQSWLHEEWVMLYASGVLHSVQESLLEIYITKTLHEGACRELGCWKKHVSPMVRNCKTQILLLKSILLRTLSDLTLREDFRRDINNALLLCQLYDLMVTNVEHPQPAAYRTMHRSLRERLSWNLATTNSRLLYSFVLPVCFFSVNHVEWMWILFEYNDRFRIQMEEKSLAVEPRTYADHTFTLIISRLYYPVVNPHPMEGHHNNSLVNTTKKNYEKVTGNRHHRIPLLNRLMNLSEETPLPVDDKLNYDDPEIKRRASMPSPAVSVVHPGAKSDTLTAEGTVSRKKSDFLESTMRDCLGGFSALDLSSDESFCMYLRRRDPRMVTWIEAGLRSYRFADAV